MDSPESEQFDQLYRRVWAALRRHDDADLSQHEMQLLHHVPAPPSAGVPLNHLARHLALPKSTASALVKDLEQRGFLVRSRDPRNERQLSIVLTPSGARRVAADTVLDLERLDRALRALSAVDRQRLLASLARLADTSEHL